MYFGQDCSTKGPPPPLLSKNKNANGKQGDLSIEAKRKNTLKEIEGKLPCVTWREAKPEKAYLLSS